MLRFCQSFVVSSLLMVGGISSIYAADIAIVLPLSGSAAKAGQTIKDGLVANYYQSLADGKTSPVLRFYDSNTNDLSRLLDKAITPDTQLMIGPLLKEQVNQVLANPPSVPVLALNKNAEQNVHGIWQFALSPEDELEPLIDTMRQAGIKQVRVLRQSDEGSLRLSQSFEQAWQAQGGSVIPAYVLQDGAQGGISASVRQLLADNQTKKTQAFMLATPSLALQVIPLLRFYQQQPLPVYSSASAYDSLAPLLQRQDLEGLRFCGLPWELNGNWPEQDSLAVYAPPESGSYSRLLAFGADAWQLSHLIPPIKTVTLPARTGVLTLSSDGLQRQPLCAEVTHGQAHLLANPTTGTNR